MQKAAPPTSSQRPPHAVSDAALGDADRYAHLLEEAKKIKGVSLWQRAMRRLRRNFAAMASLTFLIVLAISALLTPLIPLQSPVEQKLQNRKFLPPGISGENASVNLELAASSGQDFDERMQQLWFRPNSFDQMLIRARVAMFGDWCIPSLCGTDHLGRDLLARLFWGARVSLIVGVVATLVSLVIGVSYGATAGYFGGFVDDVMMRIVDILYSVPFIFVVIFVITILSQEDIKRWLEDHYIDQITVFYIVIGAIYWLTMSRVVRGQVISLKNEQFVEAARVVGASPPRIIFRHLVPNVLSVVIVYLTLTIPAVMLFEAFLSFLGLGVKPPDVSWGLLANDGIRVITPIKTFWWLVVFPGLALGLTLFSLNFLGDGLRDALDPRLKDR